MLSTRDRAHAGNATVRSKATGLVRKQGADCFQFTLPGGTLSVENPTENSCTDAGNYNAAWEVRAA